jgi:glycerophosphoryl diester phosphodiesterase
MKNKKNLWKHFLVTSLSAILLGTTANLADIQQAHAKVPWNGFVLEAHRGGRDARPENTLISFAYGMEIGVTTLEMDMQLTKDGHIVISHNPFMAPWLAKGPDGKYVQKEFQYDLREMTLDQIKQFDIGTMNPDYPGYEDYYQSHGKTQISVPGTRMPTLEEVFELANAYGNTKVHFDIETKSYADPKDPGYKNNPDPAEFVKKVDEIVRKYHMQDRVTLQTFDWRTIVEMKKIDPAITTVALVNEEPSWGWVEGCYLKIGDDKPSPWLAGININKKPYLGDYVKAAHAIGADAVSVYYGELSPNLVDEAHSFGMHALAWTVDDVKSMNMLIDMGVDGIITDKPWMLKDVLQKRGIPTPEPTVDVNSPYHTGTAINDAESKQLANGGFAAH